MGLRRKLIIRELGSHGRVIKPSGEVPWLYLMLWAQLVPSPRNLTWLWIQEALYCFLKRKKNMFHSRRQILLWCICEKWLLFNEYRLQSVLYLVHVTLMVSFPSPLWTAVISSWCLCFLHISFASQIEHTCICRLHTHVARYENENQTFLHILLCNPLFLQLKAKNLFQISFLYTQSVLFSDFRALLVALFNSVSGAPDRSSFCYCKAWHVLLLRYEFCVWYLRFIMFLLRDESWRDSLVGKLPVTQTQGPEF